MDTMSQSHERHVAWTLSLLPSAFFAGALVFAPVPFVASLGNKKVLVHVAERLLKEHGSYPDSYAEELVSSFLEDANEASSFSPLALAGSAIRFVTRKLTLVWDAKSGHDRVGVVVAFAHALDVALTQSRQREARDLGAALRTVVADADKAPVRVLALSLQEAFAHRGSPREVKVSVLASVAAQTETLRRAFAEKLAS